MNESDTRESDAETGAGTDTGAAQAATAAPAAAAGGPVLLNAETASEYDFVIGLDASGSMGEPSTRFQGKNRWEEAQEIILGISRELAVYDQDGLDIVVFGGDVQVFDSVTPDKVRDVFATRGPRGTTPLDGALERIVAKQRSSGKNTVAIIFTDGAPNDRNAVERIIVDAANSLDRDEQLTFLFVQIGTDSGAAAFLDYLDDELQGKGAKFDIVDAVPAAVAESMSALDLVNKAIND